MDLWNDLNTTLESRWPRKELIEMHCTLLPVLLEKVVGADTLQPPTIIRTRAQFKWHEVFGKLVLAVPRHSSPIAFSYYICDLYTHWLTSSGMLPEASRYEVASLMALIIIRHKFSEPAVASLFLIWMEPYEKEDYDGDLLQFPGLKPWDRAKINLALYLSNNPEENISGIAGRIAEHDVPPLGKYDKERFEADIALAVLPVVERMARANGLL